VRKFADFTSGAGLTSQGFFAHELAGVHAFSCNCFRANSMPDLDWFGFSIASGGKQVLLFRLGKFGR
jgi:hypothetical protein